MLYTHSGIISVFFLFLIIRFLNIIFQMLEINNISGIVFPSSSTFIAQFLPNDNFLNCILRYLNIWFVPYRVSLSVKLNSSSVKIYFKTKTKFRIVIFIGQVLRSSLIPLCTSETDLDWIMWSNGSNRNKKYSVEIVHRGGLYNTTIKLFCQCTWY